MRLYELNKKIGIYKISFKGSNKVYIGQSINLRNRLKYHKVMLKKNEHNNIKLQHSCNKYGFNNINIEILEFIDDINKDKLNELELKYINKYNSFYDGLNCTIGGDSKINISTKEIFQYDIKTGELIQSCFGYINMERLTGINESNIRQICNGKMKTAKGFHFSLKLKTNEEVLNDIIKLNTTQVYKEKWSNMKLGKGNGMYGKKHSNETKQKIRNKNKNKIKKRKFDYNLIIKMYNEELLTQNEIPKKLNT